jgi:hypothetical protein
MNGDSIPDDDHVLRHVKARFIQGDEIDGSAFFLRPGETQLSFNWMNVIKTSALTSNFDLSEKRFHCS